MGVGFMVIKSLEYGTGSAFALTCKLLCVAISYEKCALNSVSRSGNGSSRRRVTKKQHGWGIGVASGTLTLKDSGRKISTGSEEDYDNGSEESSPAWLALSTGRLEF
jgi:hypothetical protein